jgi:hypothetical protein
MATSKVFHFKKTGSTRVARDNKITSPTVIKGEAPQPVPDSLGSSLEAMIYRSLIAARWRPDQIEIQTPILGGRNPRGGGQILDFVLFKPYATPIKAHGDWFHKDKDEDFEKDNKVRELYGKDPIIIWGHECSKNGSQVYDFNQTLAAVIRKVGRA